MTQFQLNGAQKNLAGSLADLIHQEGLIDEPAIAIAVNEQVVSRPLWSATIIAPGDRVEIVKPFSGG